VSDAKALLDAFGGNKSLAVERDKAIEEIKARPEEFVKAQQAERTQQFQSYTKEMSDYVTAMTKDLPWCKIQDIPADATPEVKARIEKENQFFKDSEARFQAMLYPANATVRAQTALAACLSFKLAADLETANATAKHWYDEAQKLQQANDAIKKAGITSRNGGTIPAGGKTKIDTSKMTDDEAIDAGLDAVGA
jgi:hypothetical protein